MHDSTPLTPHLSFRPDRTVAPNPKGRHPNQPVAKEEGRPQKSQPYQLKLPILAKNQGGGMVVSFPQTNVSINAW